MIFILIDKYDKILGIVSGFQQQLRIVGTRKGPRKGPRMGSNKSLGRLEPGEDPGKDGKWNKHWLAENNIIFESLRSRKGH